MDVAELGQIRVGPPELASTAEDRRALGINFRADSRTTPAPAFGLAPHLSPQDALSRRTRRNAQSAVLCADYASMPTLYG